MRKIGTKYIPGLSLSVCYDRLLSWASVDSDFFNLVSQGNFFISGNMLRLTTRSMCKLCPYDLGRGVIVFLQGMRSFKISFSHPEGRYVEILKAAPSTNKKLRSMYKVRTLVSILYISYCIGWSIGSLHESSFQRILQFRTNRKLWQYVHLS